MRYLLIVFSSLALAACDPFRKPDTMMEEYLVRLARVLEVEFHATPLPASPSLPRPRERTLLVEQQTLGMLDFLALYGCDLQHVVSERNSTLGRVMHPSSLLAYEVRFINAAEECVDLIERASLAERVEEATRIKRETLPDVVWNAVWASREVEAFFGRSRGALPIGVDLDWVSDSVEMTQALTQALELVAAGDVDVDLSAMDLTYQRWLNDSLAGQMIMSAVLMATRLDDAAGLIEQRLGERPLCVQGMSNRQAEVMRNIMVSVYASHVQVYLADVARTRRALLPLLQRLAALSEPFPSEPFQSFFMFALDESSAAGWWPALDRAVIRHAQAWQGLLDQCGLQAGRS